MLKPLVFGLLAVARPAGAEPAKDLAPDLVPPVRIEAASKPVDAEEDGHSAPFVGDFDGDGKNDLLVGQFKGGLLKIYRNEGTNAQPKLAGPQKFKEGAETGRVPTG